MINLLPPSEIDNFLIEKKERVTIIFWFLVFFFILCLSLVLFSVKVYVEGQADFQETFFAGTKTQEKQEKINNFRNQIESLNHRINKTNTYYQNKNYFSDILKEVLSVVPEEMYLDNISLALKTDKPEGSSLIFVSLRGFSPTREKLSDLKENLEKKNGKTSFSNISFPPSNWLKKHNIDFSVTFEIAL
jgi:Tfp pilus assembly protein PilN